MTQKVWVFKFVIKALRKWYCKHVINKGCLKEFNCRPSRDSKDMISQHLPPWLEMHGLDKLQQIVLHSESTPGRYSKTSKGMSQNLSDTARSEPLFTNVLLTFSKKTRKNLRHKTLRLDIPYVRSLNSVCEWKFEVILILLFSGRWLG